MQGYMLWLVAGFVLVLAELVSGTFYLLVLGVAAFAGAGAAYAGAAFWIQAVVASGVALAGVWWVHQHRKASKVAAMPSLDAGQSVQFDSWVNQAGGMARVKYRGATWDAQLPAGESPAAGDVYYIVSTDGNNLTVSRTRP